MLVCFFWLMLMILRPGKVYFINAPEESKGEKRSNSIFVACDIL